MNTKDTENITPVSRIKAKILNRIRTTDFRDGVIVLGCPIELRPVFFKACEELKEELMERRVTISILEEEPEPENQEEEENLSGGLDASILAIAFSLACDELSKLDGRAGNELRVSFAKEAFLSFQSMSEEELEAFLKEKFPIPENAG